MANLERIVSRYLQADLSPPLGKPGGPCQVVQRIDKSVRNPNLRQDLIQDVEKGEDLSNPDAAKVYVVGREPGVGPIKQVQITSHAQYRMDLRSIRVDDVRSCLADFLKQMEAWKAAQNKAFENMGSMLEDGHKIEWVDRKSKLKIVFQSIGNGTVTLISTFWKGVPDPTPPKSCKI
jgi:hypothetical protein